MRLNDIAMVAADTTRTKYYLQKLIDSDLLPSYVILLLNNKTLPLPGQKKHNSSEELIDLLERSSIPYCIAPDSDINSNKVIATISNRAESVFIFSGFGGVLLGDEVLGLGKRFLHIHGGYLPDYKGSTTNYYSLINEKSIGASSIFLTKDIDCGPILFRRKFPPPKDCTKIDHIYDSKARSEVLIETLKKYVCYGSWNFDFKDNLNGETYYIIHPVLKHIAILGGK